MPPQVVCVPPTVVVRPPMPTPAHAPPPPPATPPVTYNSLIFNWALCDEVLQLLNRLLADGRLLKGATAGLGMSNEGRGESLQTISANESILAERCKALLSLRLQKEMFRKWKILFDYGWLIEVMQKL